MDFFPDELYNIRDGNETEDDIGFIVDIYFDSVVRAVKKKQGDRRRHENDNENDRTEAINFIALLAEMKPEHYQKHFEKVRPSLSYANTFDRLKFHQLQVVDLSGDDLSYEKRMSIREILLVLRDMMIRQEFPKQWVFMVMLQNSAVMKALKHIALAIRTHLTSGDAFSFETWLEFFNCARVFITQPSLK